MSQSQPFEKGAARRADPLGRAADCRRTIDSRLTQLITLCGHGGRFRPSTSARLLSARETARKLRRASKNNELVASFQECTHCLPWPWRRLRAVAACGAVRKIRGTPRQRVGANAHEYCMFCSGTPEMYEPHM